MRFSTFNKVFWCTIRLTGSIPFRSRGQSWTETAKIEPNPTYKVVFGLVNSAANDLFTVTSLIYSTSRRGHTNYFLTETALMCTSISSHDDSMRYDLTLQACVDGQMAPYAVQTVTICRMTIMCVLIEVRQPSWSVGSRMLYSVIPINPLVLIGLVGFM